MFARFSRAHALPIPLLPCNDERVKHLPPGNSFACPDKRNPQGFLAHIHPGETGGGPESFITGFLRPEFPGRPGAADAYVMDALHCDIGENVIVSVEEGLDTKLAHPAMDECLLTRFCSSTAASTISGIDIITCVASDRVMNKKELPSGL